MKTGLSFDEWASRRSRPLPTDDEVRMAAWRKCYEARPTKQGVVFGAYALDGLAVCIMGQRRLRAWGV